MKLQGSRKAIGLSLTLALIATLMIGVSAPAQAAVGTQKCSSHVVFIGVRGTNAPAGTGSTENGMLYTSGGFGSEVDPVRTKLLNGAGPTVWARALSYPATSIGKPDYPQSMTLGATKLVDFLNTIPSCPIRPAVLLAGHSQGADVILTALASSRLTNAARSSIKAVAVYGDPTWRAGMNYNASGSPTGRAGTLLPRLTALTDILETNYWFWGWPQGGSQMAYSSRIRSYCFLNDWACQGHLLNSTTDAIHNSYDTKATEVYNWFSYMLQWN